MFVPTFDHSFHEFPSAIPFAPVPGCVVAGQYMQKTSLDPLLDPHHVKPGSLAASLSPPACPGAMPTRPFPPRHDCFSVSPTPFRVGPTRYNLPITACGFASTIPAVRQFPAEAVEAERIGIS